MKKAMTTKGAKTRTLQVYKTGAGPQLFVEKDGKVLRLGGPGKGATYEIEGIKPGGVFKRVFKRSGVFKLEGGPVKKKALHVKPERAKPRHAKPRKRKRRINL